MRSGGFDIERPTRRRMSMDLTLTGEHMRSATWNSVSLCAMHAGPFKNCPPLVCSRERHCCWKITFSLPLNLYGLG